MHRVSLKGKKYHTSEAGIENFYPDSGTALYKCAVQSYLCTEI